ncbi:MAG: terminase small subunit [Alphaproteobacteria bacterium]
MTDETEKVDNANAVEPVRRLTNRQKEFAKYYIEGRYSNAECARKAGYAEDSANVQASKLLNGRDFPLVVEYIAEEREARERKYGVTLINQLKRFDELSHSAEEAGQFSAAINAEKIRSSLGGLTIDRRETTNVHKYDDLTREEITARLAKLQEKYPAAFIEGDYSEVTDVETRTEPMATLEEKLTAEDTRDED